MRLFFLSCCLLLAVCSARAQDVILKNSKEEITGKVVEVLPDQIKYRPADNPSGPLYTLPRSEVFMIIYQNGKREIIKNSAAPEPAARRTEGPADKPAVPPTQPDKTEAAAQTVSDDPYTFTARFPPGAPRSRATASDRLANIGVSLNTLGKTTMPTISFITEVFAAKNISVSIGSQFSYDKGEVLGYSLSTTGMGILLGGAYTFNHLLKIPKTKGSVYAGAALTWTTVTLDSDNQNIPFSSSSSFGFLGRVGGRYHFSRHIGVFGELQFAQGGAGFLAGISIINIKPRGK